MNIVNTQSQLPALVAQAGGLEAWLDKAEVFVAKGDIDFGIRRAVGIATGLLSVQWFTGHIVYFPSKPYTSRRPLNTGERDECRSAINETLLG